jgi:hypothetical protein
MTLLMKYEVYYRPNVGDFHNRLQDQQKKALSERSI